jgi:hypothetical protein
MISELKDEEILEFLMTSDLAEQYRPEDYKYLIFKFKQFYKILYGKYQLYKDSNELNLKSLNESNESLNNQLQKLLIENANLKNKIDQLQLPVKLSIKERITGEFSPKK